MTFSALDTAYATFKVSKEVKVTKVRTKSGKKKRLTKTVDLGKVPYDYITAVKINIQLAKAEKLTIEFGGMSIEEATKVTDMFTRGNRVHATWGVKGKWFIEKIYTIKEYKTKYGDKIAFFAICWDRGVVAKEIELHKVYKNDNVSDIVKHIASLAGMDAIVNIQKDPKINFTCARRSAAECLYRIATKYGYAIRYDKNTVYLEEIEMDGPPMATFIYGGVKGDVVSFGYEYTINANTGTGTKAKNKNNSKKGTSKSEDDKKRVSLQFYKKEGKYTTKTVSVKGISPHKKSKSTSKGASTDRTKVVTDKGKARQQRADASQSRRRRSSRKSTLQLINTKVSRVNGTVYIKRVAKKHAGKYYVHQINYTLQNGYWDVKLSLGRLPVTRSTGPKQNKNKNKKNKKGAKPPLKKRINIKYGRADGTHTAQVVTIKPRSATSALNTASNVVGSVTS